MKKIKLFILALFASLVGCEKPEDPPGKPKIIALNELPFLISENEVGGMVSFMRGAYKCDLYFTMAALADGFQMRRVSVSDADYSSMMIDLMCNGENEIFSMSSMQVETFIDLSVKAREEGYDFSLNARLFNMNSSEFMSLDDVRLELTAEHAKALSSVAVQTAKMLN